MRRKSNGVLANFAPRNGSDQFDFPAIRTPDGVGTLLGKVKGGGVLVSMRQEPVYPEKCSEEEREKIRRRTGPCRNVIFGYCERHDVVYLKKCQLCEDEVMNEKSYLFDDELAVGAGVLPG